MTTKIPAVPKVRPKKKPLRVLAVDFDGCLCENRWPNIGLPNRNVIDAVKARRHEGWKIILWTCREGKLLDDAVAWCAEQGIGFDAVNENLPELIAQYRADPRKISADEYWDDHAVCMKGEEPCTAM